MAWTNENPFRPSGSEIPFGVEDWELDVASRLAKVRDLAGGRPAVVTQEREWTYDELEVEANRIAAGLISTSLPADRTVAIALPTGFSAYAAFLGIQKAGRISWAIDLQQAEHWNAKMVANSRTGIILTTASARSSVERWSGSSRVVVWEDFGTGEARSPGLKLDPGSGAVLIYTSGSTGMPKGVLLSHRALLHWAWAQSWALRLVPGDRMSHLYTLTTAGGVRGMMAGLASGATLLPYSVRNLGLEGVPDWISGHRVGVLHCVSTLFRHFTSIMDPAWYAGHVRALMFGGERALASDVVEARRRFPAMPAVVSGLGSSETGALTNLFVPTDLPLEGPVLPYGFAVPGKDVRIINEQELEVPAGEPGELMVHSRYLALGYWHDLNSEAGPFRRAITGDGSSTFLSRDRGRRLPGGCLERMGRADRQLKIRGFRVELGAVESAFLDFPGVRNGLAFPVEDQEGHAEILVCLEASEPATEDELRRHAADRLDTFSMPSRFLVLPRFPRLPDGKTDRSALLLEAARSRPGPAVVEPSGGEPVVEVLGALCGQLLGRPPLSATDDLLRSGGHSLVVLRLVHEIRRRFGCVVSPSEIFTKSAVGEMARLVEQRGARVQPIRGVGDGPVLFAVPGVGGVNYYPEGLLARLQTAGRCHDGLQYPGVGGECPPLDRVPEIARVLLQQIGQIHPSGPLVLAGYSLGGRVAHEMACQLERVGRRPCLLILIDSGTPGVLAKRPWPRALRLLIAYLWRCGPRAALRFLSSRWSGKWRLGQERVREQLGLGGSGETDERSPAIDQQIRKAVLDACFRAIEAHRPGHYSGAALLIRSTDPFGWGVFRERGPVNGWDSFIHGPIEVREAPGDHWQLLRPPAIHVVGDVLVEAMSSLNWSVRADSGTGTGTGEGPAASGPRGNMG